MKPSSRETRIDAIEFEGARGCARSRVEGITPLTVLTGPSGSGKSTVLDAFRIAAGSAHPVRGAGFVHVTHEGRTICKGSVTTSPVGFRPPAVLEEGDWLKVRSASNDTFDQCEDVATALLEGDREGMVAVAKAVQSDVCSLDQEYEQEIYVGYLRDGVVQRHHAPACGRGLLSALATEAVLQLTNEGVVLSESPDRDLHPTALRVVAGRIAAWASGARRTVVLETCSLELIDELVFACKALGQLSILSVHRLASGRRFDKAQRWSGAEARFARREFGRELR